VGQDFAAVLPVVRADVSPNLEIPALTWPAWAGPR